MSTPIKGRRAVAGCGAEVEYTPGDVVAALSVDKTVARVAGATLRVDLTCNNPTTPHTVFYDVDPLKGQITASQKGGTVVATVTDQYWLNFAETMVKTAYERRDQAADKIQGFAQVLLLGSYWLIGNGEDSQEGIIRSTTAGGHPASIRGRAEPQSALAGVGRRRVSCRCGCRCLGAVVGRIPCQADQ